MKKISIIVPVYNVEDYLPSCLDSICEQSLTDIQVICVDDCSTDSSWEILKAYSDKYRFVEIFKNSGNMGLAYTRNEGVRHACGTYIMYVDSDDYLAPDCLSMVYEQMQTDSLDILFFDVQEFEDGNNKLNARRIRKNCYEPISGYKLMASLVKNAEMFGAVWGAAYRREYIEEQEIKFIDGILHEDIAYTFAAVLNAKRAYVTNQIVYYYRQRADSILHNPDWSELLRGLTVTYASMLLTWNDFLYRENCSGEDAVYLMKYMDSVVRLMRSRFLHVPESENTDMVTGNFFYNFCFSRRMMLEAYFEPEDIRCMEKAGEVCVYGAGNMAGEVIETLLECGIRIRGVYVTDASENGAYICGVPVSPYTDISFSEKSQCMVIAVSRAWQCEIVGLLEENKFKGSIVKVK